MDLKDGFLAGGESLRRPWFDITETNKENGDCPELGWERVVGIKNEAMNRRLIDISAGASTERTDCQTVCSEGNIVAFSRHFSYL